MKVRGKSSDSIYAFITGELEVGAVEQYLAMWPAGKDPNPEAHLWRRVESSFKCGWNAQNIGRNTSAAIPFQIATFLALPNAEKYTGHCFRRTATTTAATRGGNEHEIKAFTRHSSSNMVQHYIGKSDGMKLKNANRVALAATTNFDVHAIDKKPSSTATVNYNSAATSSSTSITSAPTAVIFNISNANGFSFFGNK